MQIEIVRDNLDAFAVSSGSSIVDAVRFGLWDSTYDSPAVAP